MAHTEEGLLRFLRNATSRRDSLGRRSFPQVVYKDQSAMDHFPGGTGTGSAAEGHLSLLPNNSSLYPCHQHGRPAGLPTSTHGDEKGLDPASAASRAAALNRTAVAFAAAGALVMHTHHVSEGAWWGHPSYARWRLVRSGGSC